MQPVSFPTTKSMGAKHDAHGKFQERIPESLTLREADVSYPSSSYVPQTPEAIAKGLASMDTKYSAVFATWVRDERNLHQSIPHFCRIANQYNLQQIIVAVRWLTESWILNSTILLVNQLTFQWQNEVDTALLVRSLCEEMKLKSVRSLISAVLERWNPGAERLRLVQEDRMMDLDSIVDRELAITYCLKQERFLRALMQGWPQQRISQTFLRLGSAVHWDVKAAVFRSLIRKPNETPANTTQKTGVLMDGEDTVMADCLPEPIQTAFLPQQDPTGLDSIAEATTPKTPSHRRKSIMSYLGDFPEDDVM